MEGINYDNYYWQNDLVRLRAGRPEDWEEHYRDSFDSKARLLLQYEIELTKGDFAANERTVYGIDHTEPESR